MAPLRPRILLKAAFTASAGLSVRCDRESVNSYTHTQRPAPGVVGVKIIYQSKAVYTVDGRKETW